MNLVIVESPTKARTLSRFLGSDFYVEATMGHIKDLPKNKLGVDIYNNFEPNYQIIPKRRQTVEKIKSEFQKADKTFIATDPDREGEAIAQHVYEVLVSRSPKVSKEINSQVLDSNPLIQRIAFHEITKKAVENAIKSPREIDENLVNAQIARRVLDRLVGYKLSPLLWKKVRKGLSAGRVQSVAVRLIVEREREIEAFQPEEYWDIWAVVKGLKKGVNDKSFQVQLIKLAGKKLEIKNQNQAEGIVSDLEKSDYQVFDVKRRKIKKSPYPPFTTSTMTQAASRFFGWSAKKTMTIAQTLYEEGLITYHRTDSTNLSDEAINSVRDFIKTNFGQKYLPVNPRLYKTKSKVAQEAHEAIRPTNIDTKYEIRNTRYEKEGQMLYNLIWKRFVACQMTDCEFDETKIYVEARKRKDSEAKVYLLLTKGQIMIFDGWRKVIPLSKDLGQVLPKVEKGDPLSLIKVVSEQKFTQPPPRYNEATLIRTLEKLGIGRPSTYAPIISTIQIRQYVEKEDGKFKPTPVGVSVNDFLLKYFSDIFDYKFTAEMESDLDMIANGEKEWHRMMHEFWTPFSERLEEVERNSQRVEIETEKLGIVCPECKKGDLVIRIGKFGKFISCSNFPDCKYKEKYIQKIDIKCPDCKVGDVVVKSTKRGKKFYGCSRYPECKWASWRKPVKE